VSTDTWDVTELYDLIGSLLAGKPSQVQGAALADLLATWLAGHIVKDDKRETDRMRERLLKMHVKTVRQLIPVNANRIHRAQA
jgi:hypothetical protein